jgi:hypothetical protein
MLNAQDKVPNAKPKSFFMSTDPKPPGHARDSKFITSAHGIPVYPLALGTLSMTPGHGLYVSLLQHLNMIVSTCQGQTPMQYNSHCYTKTNAEQHVEMLTLPLKSS